MSKRKSSPPPVSYEFMTDGRRRTPEQQAAQARLQEHRRKRDAAIAELWRRLLNLEAYHQDQRDAQARIYGPPVCPHCGASYNAPVQSRQGTPGSGVRRDGRTDQAGDGDGS